jgi:hypothetical protein
MNDKGLRIYLASIIVNVLRKRRATVRARAPKTLDALERA